MKLLDVFTCVVFLLLNMVFFSTTGFCQQNQDLNATFSETAIDKVKDFYGQLNNLTSPFFEADEKRIFKSKILEEYILPGGKSYLENNLTSDGSPYFSAEEYLNSLTSYFPYPEHPPVFTVEETPEPVSTVPIIQEDKIQCNVTFTLSFSGRFNSGEDLGRDYVASILFPGNNPARGYLSNIHQTTAREQLAMAEEVKKITEEKLAWEKVRDSDLLAAWRSFLKEYPDGQYRIEAENRVRQLERVQELANEEQQWQLALEANSVEAYNEFIQSYALSEHRSEAIQRIGELKRKEREYFDNLAWEEAVRQNSQDGYQQYLDIYPLGIGKHSSEASEKMALLIRNKMGGISYQGAFSGGSGSALFSLIFPGWGQYKVNAQKAPYFIIGTAAYGLAGTGAYFYNKHIQAANLYNDRSTPAEELPGLLKEVDQHYITGISLIAGGVAIWLTDVLWVSEKGSKNARKFKQQSGDLSIYPLITPQSLPGSAGAGIGVAIQF